MKVGLDTSVVLRLLTGQPSAQAAAAVAFLDAVQRRGDRAVLSDLVVAETYFALQHHYGVKKADALGALHRLFEDGEIAATGRAGEVLATRSLASAKPGFVDRLIHRAYVTGGGRMATFETSAARLPAVVVLGKSEIDDATASKSSRRGGGVVGRTVKAVGTAIANGRASSSAVCQRCRGAGGRVRPVDGAEQASALCTCGRA